MPGIFAWFEGEFGHDEVNSRLKIATMVNRDMSSSDPESFIQKRGQDYGVHHLRATEAGKLSDVLARAIPLTSVKVEELCDMGAVYLNEERVLEPSANVAIGDYLRVHTTPRRFFFDLEHLKNMVIFENADFVVIDKPPGIPVHATVDNRKENLLLLAEEKLGVELKVTHRLDIATSGLMVLAKTAEFQAQFNQYLKSGRVTKCYRALASLPENFKPTKLVHFMEPSPRAPKRVSFIRQPEWLKCSLEILSVKLIASGVSEVGIRLETGRTHQIRAQLAAIGAPLVGDNSYGSKWHAISKRQDIALQSFRLEFPGGHKFELRNESWGSEKLSHFRA